MRGTDPWFEQWYLTYSEKLYRTAKVLLDDQERAREIVHDVFVILLLRRAKIETYDNIGSWLFKVLHYRIENEMRLASNTREIPLDNNHQDISAPDIPDKLEDILPAGLSSHEKQILIWYFEDDLSHEEIALRFHCSVHACHMRLYRAKHKCYKLLTKK